MRRLEHILPGWASQDIGVIGARLLNVFGDGGRKDTRAAAGSEELTLAIAVSDVGYRLMLANRAGDILSDQRRWLCVDPAEAAPSRALAHAVASAPRGAPLTEENIGAVALFVDDARLHLTDHRAARLSNFEPRALRQFGVQQAGGKPVVFASRQYGETGGSELERRIIAYLPDDELESLFFPLGAHAVSLKAVAPAAALRLEAEGDAVMSLRVHGYFSTITLATPQSGVITSRQIPLGALSAAARFAAAFGLPLDQACAALGERSRFAPVEAALANPAPAEYATASFAALAPFLRAFHDEIAATLDYYQFERYADRPARLELTFTGPSLSGLGDWLADALHMEAVTVADDPMQALPHAGDMNLLENVRSGLLKVGSEPYLFENGAFRPAEPRNRRAPGRRATGGPREQKSGGAFAGLLGGASGKDGQTSGARALLGPAFAAIAAPVLLVVLTMNFLVAPAQKTLDRRTAAYAALLEDSGAGLVSAQAAPALAQAGVSGWAQNLVALGDAMLPAMQVTALTLTGAEGEGQTGQVLEIDGLLPQAAGGDLRLVAGFIDRLGKDDAFARDFPRVEFAGLSTPEGEIRPGAAFRVVAASEDSGAAR